MYLVTAALASGPPDRHQGGRRTHAGENLNATSMPCHGQLGKPHSRRSPEWEELNVYELNARTSAGSGELPVSAEGAGPPATLATAREPAAGRLQPARA